VRPLLLALVGTFKPPVAGDKNNQSGRLTGYAPLMSAEPFMAGSMRLFRSVTAYSPKALKLIRSVGQVAAWAGGIVRNSIAWTTFLAPCLVIDAIPCALAHQRKRVPVLPAFAPPVFPSMCPMWMELPVPRLCTSHFLTFHHVAQRWPIWSRLTW
jgi:hypothetical protein